MKIRFTCASVNEKAQTVTIKQLISAFTGLKLNNFNKGAKYRIYFENGNHVDAIVNRAFKTLYIPAVNLNKGFKRATVGSPLNKQVKQLKRISG